MNRLPDKTFFESNAELLLKEAGLSKAKFAERMGIARQNLQKLFGTKNIFSLIQAADVLGVPLLTLIYGKENETVIDGFVEVNGTVFRVKSRKDIEDLLTKI